MKATEARPRNHRYLIDRVASGVESILKCSVINPLPKVKVVSDCPNGKLGYYLGGDTIYIDRSAVELGSFIYDRVLCHEFLHWIGIDDEDVAHDLDRPCACYMPIA